MGLQPPTPGGTGKATPTAPSMAGGKNSGQMQQQPGYGQGMPMQNDMMRGMMPQARLNIPQGFMGQGGSPGAQGFQGGMGQMSNPNMGGMRGFGGSSINTLSGGPSTQPGGNMQGGGTMQGGFQNNLRRPIDGAQ